MFAVSTETLSTTKIGVFDLFPEMRKIPERTIAPILIRRNIKEDIKNADTQNKNCIFVVPTEHDTAECEWYPIMSNHSHLLGYYYKVRLAIEKSAEDIIPTMFEEGNINAYEFYYSHTNNIYWQGPKYAQKHTKTIGERKQSNAFSTNKKTDVRDFLEAEEKVTQKNEEKKRLGSNLPDFYRLLLPQLERICSEIRDTTIIERILKKPNSGDGIVTYRISSTGCEKVTHHTAGLLSLHVIEMENDITTQRKEVEKDNVGEKVVRSSIKSKKTLERTMEQLPTPSEFWKLLALCIIIFLVGVGISVSDYIIYEDLFRQQEQVVKMLIYQAEQYRSLSQGASAILQAVSVNE